jgi:hypothetical protein
VDVQGHSGYAAVLTQELLDERRTNPIEVRRTLETLIGAYKFSDRAHFAVPVLADFFLEALRLRLRGARFSSPQRARWRRSCHRNGGARRPRQGERTSQKAIGF